MLTRVLSTVEAPLSWFHKQRLPPRCQVASYAQLHPLLSIPALQSAQKLVAAAAAAAASAAANAALNKQPWDTLELQMEVVETTRPFFRSGRFCVAGESQQRLLFLSAALLAVLGSQPAGSVTGCAAVGLDLPVLGHG